MGLTPRQRDFYEENGYLLKKQLIPPDWVAKIDREIENIHERMAAHPAEDVTVSWEDFDDPNTPKRIKQLMHSELVSPTLNRTLRCDPLLDVIEALIGPNVSLYHSKLLLKAAHDGTAIPWHQDYAYWKRDGNRPLMINCQLAIDRTDRENGCIQFVPGSHRWGLQEHERTKQTFGAFLPGHYYEREGAALVEMQPGDGVFFNALIVHGSAPNASGRHRRMNTFAYNVTGNNQTQCRETLRGEEIL